MAHVDNPSRGARDGFERDPSPGADSWVSFEGAVVVVDISGYTPLAERLCGEDRHGAERLGAILDIGFRGYVQTVRDAGGQIACFAGDAFTAYWAADDGDVRAALVRALDCARRLHGIFQPAGHQEDAAQPPLHIGVSSGRIWGAQLGVDQGIQLLLAGPAVHQACSALSQANAGQTQVAPEARRLLVSASSGRTLDQEPTGRITVQSVLSPASEPFGNKAPRMIDYASAGFAAWIPQRRTICALFVRIDGLDNLTPPPGVPRHQAAVVAIQAALRPHTGSTGTLIFDDKGLVFSVCLGMPHDTHADDALRAVKAGLAIQAALTAVELSCAAGVAAGLGVCMPLGGPERDRYLPVGPFMHVAARLMEAAGSGVLCTADVADQIRSSVHLSPEPPLTLKGLPAPLQTFRVHQAAAADDAPGVLYGRASEQETLDRYLERFQAGRGAVVLLVGEAGLGKTALIRYLRQGARQRQIRCLYGAAGSMDVAVPYMAWRSVFGALLEGPHVAAGPQTLRRQHLGAIRHEQLSALVNAVVPGYLEETPLTRSLSGQARADATVTLLSEILAARASGHFLLVLEDCHWLDPASWRLVLRVAQEHPRALIVLTSRPGVEARELPALRQLEQFAEMDLRPLPPDAIAALVEHVLGTVPDRHALVNQITELAVGHPLFAREYALLRATSTSPAQANLVPMTIQSLIASRLDALSPPEDLTLKAACVIGDTFTVDVINSARPTAQGDVNEILARLSQLQLLVSTGDDATEYAFQHALIREVAYEQLTREQRTGLHRRVAEVLEHTHARDLSPHYGTLAHHWSRAELPDPTIRYSDLAATQALTAGAFENAERLLDSCITLGASRAGFAASDRIRWYRGLADARHGLGKLEPRIAAAHRALDLSGQRRPQHTVGLLLQAAAHLLGIAFRRIAGPVLTPSDPGRTMEIARAFRHSAEVCYFNNDMLGMMCDDLSAVAFASRLPPSAVLAGASTELGGIVSAAGLRFVGERILRRAIAIAEAADDQAAQAYAHMINCLYYVGRGQWLEAERSAQRCQELCEPMDDRVNWTNAQTVRFWMSHHRSLHETAYEAACGLRERANQTGNRQHRAWALRCLAVCALRDAGLPVDPVASLRLALESLGETAALNERIPTLGLLALALERVGDSAGAAAAAAEGAAALVRVRRPIGHGTLEGYSALTAVTLRQWHQNRASEQWQRGVKECLRVLRRYSLTFPIGQPRYHLHLGDYRRMQGQLRAARRSYQTGEAAARRLGMPSEVRYCVNALAEVPAS